MSGRPKRWIINERSSGSESLDATWWEWLKVLGLCHSGTEFDIRRCGCLVGLGIQRDGSWDDDPLSCLSDRVGQVDV